MGLSVLPRFLAWKSPSFSAELDSPESSDPVDFFAPPSSPALGLILPARPAPSQATSWLRPAALLAVTPRSGRPALFGSAVLSIPFQRWLLLFGVLLAPTIFLCLLFCLLEFLPKVLQPGHQFLARWWLLSGLSFSGLIKSIRSMPLGLYHRSMGRCRPLRTSSPRNPSVELGYISIEGLSVLLLLQEG